jgi:hypothetical protein
MAQTGLYYLSIDDVARPDVRNPSGIFFPGLHDAVGHDRPLSHDFLKQVNRPAVRIPSRVAEEVEEDGLGEGVELGEGGAALGPQRLRPIQHLRDPPLLFQSWERDSHLVQMLVAQVVAFRDKYSNRTREIRCPLTFFNPTETIRH